jgi:ABC transporter domain protein
LINSCAKIIKKFVSAKYFAYLCTKKIKMASQIPYLDVQNLTKRFGAQVLFDNISFSIAEGQKVGLVARNGTGKSTLMSVLMDKEGHESGDIIYRRDLKVGYLEQSPQFDPEESVLQACFNHEDDPEKVLKAKQILTQLHITNLEQPMGQLSGGQQKRVALANVLITEPDFLMLDEPTNHLDLEMIEWLEGYLNRGNKTIFMVTHDRFFLDKVCNTILELDDRTIYTYRGNYAYYLEKRQERMDNLRAEIQHSKNLYRRELDWMRRQPQARGHKAKYREDAFYELEKVAKQRIEDRQVRLKASTVYIGSKIFECQYVSKAFDDRGQKKVILDNFYYNFARFEKMGIVGNNGTGKSTFIKMLLGEVQPDSGKFDIGETVRFGYFSQEGLKFREDQKVIDVITEIADYIDLGGGKHMTASQFLQFFLFTPEEQHNYVYKLSGGEKRKLYLCTVLMRNPNFLVLDEPTNDLDIQTLQVLEEYLQDFAGCVIVVSHDRYFMDKVVDHLLVFKGEGEIQDFPGNYTQYREWSRMQAKDEAKPAKSGNATAENDGAGTAKRDANFENKRKMSYKEKREYEQLTQEIDALTEEQKKLEEELCSGNLSVEELTEKSKRLPEIKDELDEKEMRWLELAEML